MHLTEICGAFILLLIQIKNINNKYIKIILRSKAWNYDACGFRPFNPGIIKITNKMTKKNSKRYDVKSWLAL